MKFHLHFNEQLELYVSCSFNIGSCRLVLLEALTIWVSILFMIIEDGKNCVFHSL